MSRYIKDYSVPKDAASLQSLVNSFMVREGFKVFYYKGETIWKKGYGLFTAPQFMKTVVSEKTVHVEAWIKFALLPGVYYGEMGIEGFVGLIPKKMLKKKIEELVMQIYQ